MAAYGLRALIVLLGGFFVVGALLRTGTWSPAWTALWPYSLLVLWGRFSAPSMFERTPEWSAVSQASRVALGMLATMLVTASFFRSDSSATAAITVVQIVLVVLLAMTESVLSQLAAYHRQKSASDAAVASRAMTSVRMAAGTSAGSSNPAS